MKNKAIAIVVYFVFSPCAFSLDVGDISSFIYSSSKVLSKEIKNKTDSGRLINIRIERVSSPLEGAKMVPMDSPDELLLTPGSLLLPAMSSERINFFYNGPQDEQERYYRIVWTDNAIGDSITSKANRHAVATASAQIGTILVVAPRKIRYSYQYNEATRSIKNKGNATLRIIAYGPCLSSLKKKECKENYYLLPGKSRTFSLVNLDARTAHLAMWQAENFVPVK